jgi:hypothetical protein
MLNAFVVRCLTLIGILLTSASMVSAQVSQLPQDADWARAMIDKDMLNINYKMVAKGQDVYFRVRVTNIYKEDMQITGLSTSCGCISWDENKPGPNGTAVLPAPIVVPSGQERFVTLRLDTIRHHGEQKNKRATITFFEPSKGTVGTATILAEGYIRTDVVLQPGSVNFGSVSPHSGAEQRVTVNYAGRNDWTLTSAKFTSPHLSADVVEKSRGGGLVNYELIVKLKDSAPIGHLRDQMMLSTDDANNPQIPVQVDAKIEPEIVVTDADFGRMTPGKPKEIQVLVRYTKLPIKAFKIEKFERTKNDASIKIKKSDEMKALHQFTLTFTPPNEPGLFEEEFFLTISGRDEPITFKAKGRILEAPADVDVKK